MKSSPVLIVGDGSGIGTALRSSSFSHWPLGMPFFLSSPPTSFLGTVPVLRPFLLPAPLRFIAVIGSSDGIDIGRSDGFDAGVSAGESFSSPSSLDGSDRSSDSSAGYDFGYGRFYPRGWLSGYIDGYISQHPEINEYDLLDDILYTFPDVDTDDLIDYLRSAR